MTTNWPDNDPTAADPGPVNRLAVDGGSNWPARIGGYIKLILTAITTLGTTGVLQWLQSAGVTSLPAWGSAGITAVVGLLTLLLSPKNKP
jgi:hypothetical protein